MGLCSGKGWGAWKGSLLELWLLPGAVLWERMEGLEGLTPGALPGVLCVFSQQPKLLLFGKHSWKPRSEPCFFHEQAPSFQAGVRAGTPLQEPEALVLLRCALRKKSNSVLPIPRDAVTQTWPSISCLDSWAQWEHFGLIPAPGRCSRGQAWTLLSDCLGSELPCLQESVEYVWIHTFLGLPYVCCPNAPHHPSFHQGKAGSAHAPC